MKNIDDYDFYEISADDARKLGPFGYDDHPVDVTCYGEKNRWSSYKAATAFYTAAANCCDGSERDRYVAILAGLLSNDRDVSDMR